MPVTVLSEWLSKNEVLTTVDELSQMIAGYHSSRYETKGGNHTVTGESYLMYKDFLDHIVLPTKKEKLREKILKRSGLLGKP